MLTGSDIAAKDRPSGGITQTARPGSGPSSTFGAWNTRLPRPPQDWRLVLAVFWVTQLVETLGVSQVYALLPSYLRGSWACAEADRIPFVGLFSSLVFVLGLPLVPLWGVWADKYSRKAVIVALARW